MPALIGPTPFVGRGRELTMLAARLEGARAGSGGIVLIAGEPGIGKTRVLQELAQLASDQHAAVLWGRCDDIEGAPAYWPWLQGLRAAVQDMDVGELQADLGAGAAEIAQILPAIADRLPGLPAPTPEPDPARARFRLFDALATFLRNAGRRQPLLILLDDLQWADSASLLFLQFLVRRLDGARLLVAGSYRETEVGPEHPLRRTMEALTREQASEQLDLHGLSESQVEHFVALLAGADVSKELVATISRESDGNPFFITEIVQLLRAGDRSSRAAIDGGWRLDVPETVREVIARRLTHVSRPCKEVLTIASVVGRSFRLAVLTRVADLAGVALLEALDEAVTARLIAETPGAFGQYEFTHALIRETLYSAVGPARRIRLHRQVAEALEQLHQAAPEPHLDELAYHFVQAAPGGDVSKAVAYARRAGDRAQIVLAYEEAARLYVMALQALELGDEQDHDQRYALLLALATVRRYMGDTAGVTDSAREAAGVARLLGSPERLAEAALALGFADAAIGTVDHFLVDLLEEAAHLLGDQSPGLKAKVLARLAGELYYAPDPGRRLAAAGEAVKVARAAGDREALANVLFGVHYALHGPGSTVQRLALATELVQLGEAMGDRECALKGHGIRMGDLLELGNIPAVDAEIEAYGRLAHELRRPLFLWYTHVFQAMRALLDGRLGQAEQLVLEAQSFGQAAALPHAASMHAVQQIVLRSLQGRLSEQASIIADLAAAAPGYPLWQAAAGLVAVEEGKQAEARAVFERLAVGDFADLRQDAFWPGVMTWLAETCAFLDDAGRAALIYDRLRPYADRTVVLSAAFAACLGSSSHSLGQLAAVMARANPTSAAWDAAMRHFEDALAMHTRMGARPYQARTQLAFAQALLATGDAGDRPRAQRLLSAAGDTARALGMSRLAEQVGCALREDHVERGDEPATPADAVGATAPAHESGRDGLTRREAEVLRLLAAGLSNRRIAERLVVSRRTVEHHLTAIYAKIGAQGRVEAAAYALQHGLT